MRKTGYSFMFATGIGNSYPTIQNGKRIDQMEKCRHYDKWSQDFDLLEELEISYLRYGPPIHRTWLGPGKYDWSFTDVTFGDLARRNVVPITDQAHQMNAVPKPIRNAQRDIAAAYEQNALHRTLATFRLALQERTACGAAQEPSTRVPTQLQ